jgi:hypothetical protein
MLVRVSPFLLRLASSSTPSGSSSCSGRRQPDRRRRSENPCRAP